MIEAGISSSYHIAKFFGLTDRLHQPKAGPTGISRQRPGTIALTVPVPAPEPDLAPRWQRPVPSRPAKRARTLRRRAIDVSDVITRALTAAGLMK